MKTLQLFNQYLPPTENWAYLILRHAPDTAVMVGAREYLPHNFYDPAFQFILHPFGALEAWDRSLPSRTLRGMAGKAFIRAFSPVLGSARSAIAEAARAGNVELAHAHFADVAWYFREIPLQLDIPFVVSFYGWDYEQLPVRFPKFAGRIEWLFRNAQLFVCEGPHGADILARKGCPEKKIRILPLGVEVEHIPFAARTKTPDELRLVQVAALTPKKGHLYTLQAFHQALADCPNMTLTLVGKEQGFGVESELKTYIREKRLNHKVTLLDYVDFAHLHEFLAGFHVFIHPSCYTADRDCEGGAPVVLLDAQATGLPVISTTHCDIPAEVIHERTGLLAPERDVNQLAEHIRYFYQMNAETYTSFTFRCREHIEQHFDIRQNARRLPEAYQSL